MDWMLSAEERRGLAGKEGERRVALFGGVHGVLA
jgi:hypothetical protein